jgi:hypothetical protein
MANKYGKAWSSPGCGGSTVYCLGLIGALVYYIRHGEGFWGVVAGILKALVWPAFVVYDLLELLAR